MGVTSVSLGCIAGAAPRGGAGTAGTPGCREEHSGGPRVTPAPAHSWAPAAGWPPPPHLPALLPVPPGESPHVPMAPGCPRGSPSVTAHQQPSPLVHQLSESPAITTVFPSVPAKSPTILAVSPTIPPCPQMSLIHPQPPPSPPLLFLPLQVAVVPQEPLLFARSLHANISYGLGCCSRAQVTAAARKVGAHNFITCLPQGYDTGMVSPLHSASPVWFPPILTPLSPQRWVSWEDSSPGGSGRRWPLPVRCCGTPASSSSTSTAAPWTLSASSRWDVTHVPTSPSALCSLGLHTEVPTPGDPQSLAVAEDIALTFSPAIGGTGDPRSQRIGASSADGDGAGSPGSAGTAGGCAGGGRGAPAGTPPRGAAPRQPHVAAAAGLGTTGSTGGGGPRERG